jgi:PPIC-type PPIASE domain
LGSIILVSALALVGCEPAPIEKQPLVKPTQVSAKPTPETVLAKPISKDPNNPVVGRVGDDYIYLEDILQLERRVKFNKPPGDGTWRDLILDFRKLQLEQLLFDKAVTAKVKQDGLDSRIDREVEEIFKQEGPDILEKHSLTLDEFRLLIAKKIYKDLLVEEYKKNLITEEEIRKYYKENKTTKYLTPEQLTVRRIMMFPQSEDKREEVRAQIEQLRVDILKKFETISERKARADFVSTMARKFHQVSRDRGSGGMVVMYRPTPKTSFSEEFRKAAFEAKLYELSPVLEVDNGFLLLYPSRHYGRIQQSLEDDRVRRTIYGALQMERKKNIDRNMKDKMISDTMGASYPEELAVNIPTEPNWSE